MEIHVAEDDLERHASQLGKILQGFLFEVVEEGIFRNQLPYVPLELDLGEKGMETSNERTNE